MPMLNLRKPHFNLIFLVLWLSYAISFSQIKNQKPDIDLLDQRAIMVYNLSEQVKWPSINVINTFKIGVIGSDSITNSLQKITKSRRLFDKIIEVKRINSIEEVTQFNVVYVNKAYEYLLKSILERSIGKELLVITEGYPTNSSMINMVRVGDAYSYGINRKYIREANLKITPILAGFAVSSMEIKEKLYEKAEQKLYMVSTENKEQKKIIENQIKTIDNQIKNLNIKEDALFDKENSIRRLYLDSQLKSKKIEQISYQEKEFEKKIEDQISTIYYQQSKIDSVNTEILKQKKVLEVQNKNIEEKTKILEKKNVIINTQRKQNLALTILSSLLLLTSLGLLVAYLKNKKLNKRLKTKHIFINKQSKLLKSKNKELEQFAYITSHDLQEPLNTISSFIEILKEDYTNKFDDDGKQILGFIQEGSIRMKKLIDALLQYSRLGKSKEFQDVNCMPLLDVLMEDLNSTIKNTGAVIDYKDLPIVKGNEVELRLLFQNLITNGIKFRNPNTKPEIKITCSENYNIEEKNKINEKFWIFSVTDNGIGIADEYQDRVFDIFQRLHSRLEYEGSGIGLAHCKKIVESHSGKIWFTSQKGLGTTFNFSIPIKL